MTEQPKPQPAKAYKAVMSRGDDIKLDAQEIPLVLEQAPLGRLIRVRQGLINPSYLISIVADTDRLERFYDDIKYRSDDERRNAKMKPLKDIFADLPLRIGAPQPKTSRPALGPPPEAGTGGGRTLPANTPQRTL